MPGASGAGMLRSLHQNFKAPRESFKARGVAAPAPCCPRPPAAMPETRASLALAAGLGLLSGMRSMAPLALLSRQLAGRSPRGRGPVLRLMASPRAAALLAALAAAEMAADKTPLVPDRTDALALGGRIGMGALAGAAVARWRGGPAGLGALLGGAAAAASTHFAYHLRKAAGEASPIPDPVLGLAEDALVLAAGSRLASAAPEAPTSP